jgi:hypothetical protein
MRQNKTVNQMSEDGNDEPPLPLSQQVLDLPTTRLMIERFGEQLVMCLYSKNWQHRFDALQILSGKNFHRDQRVCLIVLDSSGAIADRIPQVFMQALTLLEATLRPKTSQFDDIDEIWHQNVDLIDHFLKYLITNRLGDSNTRVRQATRQFFYALCTMAVTPAFFVHVSTFLLSNSLDNEKSLLNKLELICALVLELGLHEDETNSSSEGLSKESIIQIALDNIESKSASVRKCCAQLIMLAKKCTRKSQRGRVFDERYLSELSTNTLKFLNSEIQGELSIDLDYIQEVVQQREAAKQLTKQLSELSPSSNELSDQDNQLVQVFGRSVLDIHAKKWQSRQAVIQFVQDVLTQTSFNNKNATKAIFFLLQKGIDDNIPQVFLSAVSLLNYIFDGDVYKQLSNNASTSMTQRYVEPIIRVLVIKIGDLNSKIQEAAQQALLILTRHLSVGLDFVNIFLMEPIHDEQDMKKNWKTLVGKLELLEKMIPEFGIQQNYQQKRKDLNDEVSSPRTLSNNNSSQFTLERVMTFCVSTFASPNQQVRKAAVDCVVQVYKIAGDRIRSYLRETQNNFLLQELKSKVVKEARIQQSTRISSAPNQPRLSSIIQPIGMADHQHVDVRPQSFDAVALGGTGIQSSFVNRLGGGRKWSNNANSDDQVLVESAPTVLINTLPPVAPTTTSTVKKGKKNRFIFT